MDDKKDPSYGALASNEMKRTDLEAHNIYSCVTKHNECSSRISRNEKQIRFDRGLTGPDAVELADSNSPCTAW
jgi:hypothetical protein